MDLAHIVGKHLFTAVLGGGWERISRGLTLYPKYGKQNRSH